MIHDRLLGTPVPDEWTLNDGPNRRPLEPGMLVRMPAFANKEAVFLGRVKSVNVSGAVLIGGVNIALYSSVEYKRSASYEVEQYIDTGDNPVVDSQSGRGDHRDNNAGEINMAKNEKVKPKMAAPAVDTDEAPAKVKAAKAPREKKERPVQSCVCGCGEQTRSYFAPGHDARFKGWLSKLAKGEVESPEKLMPKSLAKALGPWATKGDGLVPSKTYQEVREAGLA